ncbi:MAG: hypothetical protein AB7D36_07395 [Oscillospiraceae bacterium]
MVVIVHYTADVSIEETPTPGGSDPGGGNSGIGDSDIDISDSEAGGKFPDTGYIAVEPDGNLPQTGTVAFPVKPMWMPGVISMLISMSAAGLFL